MKKRTLDAILDEAGLLKAPYARQYAYIEDLCAKGALKPIKAAPSNGKKPPLPSAYFQPEQMRDDARLLRELAYDLHPAIRLDYYRKHLAIYAREREHVLALSAFLHQHKDLLATAVSCNERSFQIWQDEKFLDDKGGGRLLTHCGLAPSLLNFYETAEPLPAFTLMRTTPQAVLIIENLDTFYTLRRLLGEGQIPLLGHRFGTLIYGAGKSKIPTFQQFAVSAESYLLDPGNRFFYAGDLDYEGILIFEAFARHFSQSPIEPFIPAYASMLAMARSLSLPKARVGQHKHHSGHFLSFFPPELVRAMEAVLESGCYIPQEILTAAQWRSLPEAML